MNKSEKRKWKRLIEKIYKYSKEQSRIYSSTQSDDKSLGEIEAYEDICDLIEDLYISTFICSKDVEPLNIQR